MPLKKSRACFADYPSTPSAAGKGLLLLHDQLFPAECDRRDGEITHSTKMQGYIELAVHIHITNMVHLDPWQTE